MIRTIVLTLCLIPLAANAEPPLGSGSTWFLQANLGAMRDASGDRALYEWLEREVIEDLDEEFGDGTVERFDVLSVFAAGVEQQGFGVFLEGRIDPALREEVIRRLAAEPLDDIGSGDAYLAGADSELADELNLDIEGGSLYLAFDGDTAVLATTDRRLLDDFLDGKRFDPVAASDLLVVRAGPLLSGTFDFGRMDGRWDSNIMRHVRRFGFTLSDGEDGYAIDVALATADEQRAQALHNLIQGFIGLQSIADDAEDLQFISKLTPQRQGDLVRIAVELSSSELMGILD